MSFYENFVALCNSIGKSPSATIEEIGTGDRSSKNQRPGHQQPTRGKTHHRNKTAKNGLQSRCAA